MRSGTSERRFEWASGYSCSPFLDPYDDDDIDTFYRNRPKQKRRMRRMPWSPKLLKLVRDFVVRSADDLVLPHNVAWSLKAQEHEVGVCLSILVKEGMVSEKMKISPIDEDGEKIHVRYKEDFLRWNGTKWALVVPSWWHGKSVKSPEWDGCGFLILKDKDPFKTEWNKIETNRKMKERCCVDCGVIYYSNDEQKTSSTRCGVCFIRFRSADPDVPTCVRCNSELRFRNFRGKRRIDHTFRLCNIRLVQNVLEE